jgi:hypothetical protein
MNRFVRFGISTLMVGGFSFAASFAMAEEIVGRVSMVGSSFNMRPVIQPNGSKEFVEVCEGAEEVYLRKFGSVTVKAQGSWGQSEKLKSKCFNLTEFKATQLEVGRDSVIGQLAKVEGSGHQIVSDEPGKIYKLEKASRGLKKLEGKRVIIDLVASNAKDDKNKQEVLYKVKGFMEYPSR